MSTHVGDPYYRQAAQPKKDETGKVWLRQREFSFKKNGKGQNDDTLFSKPQYLRDGKLLILTLLGDEYVDPRHINKLRDSKRPKTAKAFRTGYKGSKVRKSEFEYMPVNRQKEYTKRLGPGRVALGERGFVTAPYKKGGGRSTVGVTIANDFKYVEDDYDRKKDADRREHEMHQTRLLSREKPFMNTGIHPKTFDSTKHVFGEAEFQLVKQFQVKGVKPVDHGRPWKGTNPAKVGYNKTINKFDYKCDPGREEKRAPRPRTAGAWRPTTNGLTVPHPTIHNHFINVNKDTRRLII